MLASAPESPDAPRTIRDYADTVWAIGKLREPQRFLTEAEFNLFMAHAVGQRVLGDHHHETLTCMDHLAGVRLDLGNRDGARALATLDAGNDLAVTCLAGNDLESACALFSGVITGYREVLGDTHPETLAAVCGIATALRCPRPRPKGDGPLREGVRGRQEA